MLHRKQIEQALHWILLGVGLLIVGLLVRRVGLSQCIQLFKNAERGYWFAGIIVYGFSMLFRSFKWQILISTIHPVAMRRFMPIYLFNSVMGNLTPFKSGEAVGPLLFKRYLGFELGQGFSVILIDRIIELVWMLFCLVLGFSYLALQVSMKSVVYRAILLAGIMTLILIGLLLTVLFFERLGFQIMSFLSGLFKSVAIQNIFIRIKDELSNFYAFRKNGRLAKKMLMLNTLTGLAFFAQFTAVWLIVISLIPAHFMDSLSAQAIAIPISIISFIPAGIGIAALGYQSIMALLGYPEDQIIGAALISKVLFLSLIFFSGWVASFIIRRMERPAS